MTVKLGLVGTGTVGGGCIDILKNHREDFKRHYGIDVELVRVCSRNPEQAIAHGVEDIFTQDYQDILNDPDIDIVVELIGGTTVARDIVVGALKAGKNVVTANKALMATYGEEVMGAAASAVMGDVVEVARHVTLGVGPLVGCTCTDELPIVPMDDLKTKYYIRFKVADRSGVLAAMAGVFAKHNVSVYSVVQRGKKESGQVDLVYVTHTAREKSVRDVLAEIAELDDVLRDEPSVIRVEE